MNNHTFLGPFHFNDFTENGILKKDAINSYKIKNELGSEVKIPNLKNPGIYIWGNLFDIDDKKRILFPTDCTSLNFKFNPKKHQFVPYYVGKNESSMLKRLSQHKDVRNTSGKSDGDKYIRFSFDYWKEFFKDPLYERDSSSLINLVKIKKNSVIYHNDKAVLQEIYPQMNIIPVGSNHPITAQILYGNPLTDTLDMVVNGANNFWFCYCPVDIKSVKTLGQLETQVFYSLKGKTTSKKDKCPSVVLNDIADKTNDAKIFKKIKLKNGSELIFPNEHFWGY
jgi:hypothetical protein